MTLSDSIFRNYDIRGVYPTDINELGTEHIGKALGTLIRRKGGSKIVIGRDNRESSEPLMGNLIKGFVSTGCEVVDIGLSLTPIVHFLTCTEDFDLGVEVTASHNPKEYNGFRIDFKNAVPFYGEDIQRIKKMIVDEDYEQGKGSTTKKDLSKKYIDFLVAKFQFTSPIKVVVDCGNGTSSLFAPQLFEKLGCTVSPMYCESDPSYPHGIPDPEDVEILKDLKDHVLAENADVGIVVDPDSDRFGFVDEKGRHFDNDKILMLFAEELLENKPGGEIVFDVKSSGTLEEFIESKGGVPKRIRTGHPYFVTALKEGAVLGGEFSGHSYFGDDYFGYDDGIYASCKVIEKIIEHKRPLSYLMTLFPMRVHSTEIKLPCPDELKFGIIDTLTQNFKEIPDILEVDETDGARVKVTETGWFLIRASNTSPILSVRLEGINEQEAGYMLERVKIVLEHFDFVDSSPLNNVELYLS
jgi:phosphomannomutase / phosphoglucomutase